MNPPAGKKTANPAEEEAKKKKKNKKFWKKKKGNYDLGSSGFPINPFFNITEALEEEAARSPTDDDPEAMTRSEETMMTRLCLVGEISEQGKGASLCTAICDFMCCFPASKFYHYLGSEIKEKVMSGLKKCGNSDSVADDVVAIDIRGRNADSAMRELMFSVLTESRNPERKYLKVRVGCTKHGCGKGKLKQAVVDLYKRDVFGSIVVDYEEDNGTVISIKLKV